MILEPSEPSADLQDRIIQRLHEEAYYLRIRRQFAVLLLLLISSLAVLPFTVFALFEAARLSGFLMFVSLLFSDSAVALSQWQDVGYSLLESFPVVPMIACGVVALVASWSLSFVLREYRNVWKHRPLLHVGR